MDTNGARARRADYLQACLAVPTPFQRRRQAIISTRMPASLSDRHRKPLREQHLPTTAYRVRVQGVRREHPHQTSTNVEKVSTLGGCPSGTMGPQLPIVNAVRVSTTESLPQLSAQGYHPPALSMTVFQPSMQGRLRYQNALEYHLLVPFMSVDRVPMSASPRYRNVRGYRPRVPFTSVAIASTSANYQLATTHALCQACLRP